MRSVSRADPIECFLYDIGHTTNSVTKGKKVYCRCAWLGRNIAACMQRNTFLIMLCKQFQQSNNSQDMHLKNLRGICSNSVQLKESGIVFLLFDLRRCCTATLLNDG